MSMHISNNFAWKRGIGKKLLLTIRAITQDEHVNLVAGDFGGAAWRQTSGYNPHQTSTLEEAFADTGFRCRQAPHHCGVLELFPENGPTFADSSYLQIHMRHSQFRVKFWASVKETRAATMKYGYTWTLLATDILTDHEETMISAYFSKKDPAPIHLTRRGRYDGESDQSLSSLSSTRDPMLP